MFCCCPSCSLYSNCTMHHFPECSQLTCVFSCAIVSICLKHPLPFHLSGKDIQWMADGSGIISCEASVPQIPSALLPAVIFYFVEQNLYCGALLFSLYSSSAYLSRLRAEFLTHTSCACLYVVNLYLAPVRYLIYLVKRTNEQNKIIVKMCVYCKSGFA